MTEGKNLLIEEFGKEYTVYFSILECISRGLTSRGDIETALNGVEIGGYLSRMEKDFSVISQRKPILLVHPPNKSDTLLKTIFYLFGFDLFTSIRI